MLKKNRSSFIVILIFLFLLFIFITKIISWERHPEKSLFSWKDNPVLDQGDKLFPLLEDEGITTLYQYFDKDLEKDTIVSFLKKADKQKIDVYYLVGEPKWALENIGESHLEEVINRAGEIKEWFPEDFAFKGVVLDVEPYLLDEWDEEENTEIIMDHFIGLMKEVYSQAQEKGLKVIICIPYFYDSKGYESYLEELIASCCDSVAVMNYYREKEIEHIETEAQYAIKYKKELINIYELQEPGKHGLTDKNTYYRKGLDAVEENFKKLAEAYPGLKLSISLHEFRALEEVKSRE